MQTTTKMSGAPPVPPRPSYEGALPPPLPPLPPSFREQNEAEESPPRFENPMIAPRPHRVDRSIPGNVSVILFYFILVINRP